MAELASGAVSSLLGVIRNEAQLLGSVKGDVQFIKEEMESMNSFLMHLARTAPPGREHDEQVRTWMNQVRLLAQDCNNCINLYLYRGNPEIHLAKSGVLRYLLWVRWFLYKMVAQHNAAIKLRALKERARDVGERRLRYGVEVPGKSPTGAADGKTIPSLSSSAYAPTSSAGVDAVEDDDEEDEEDQLVVARATDHSGRRRAYFKTRTVEENIEWNVDRWTKSVSKADVKVPEGSMPSIAIVAPDDKETHALAYGAKAMASAHSMHGVLVDIPAVHFYHLHLLPRDILLYILWELNLKPANSQRQEGSADQGTGEKQDINKIKDDISTEKFKLIGEITGKIQGTKVDDKISEIKRKLEEMKVGKLDQKQLSDALVDLLAEGQSVTEPLGMLLLGLRLLKPDTTAPKTKGSQEMKEGTRMSYPYHELVKGTAKKLKAHMEEGGQQPICLHEIQYKKILQEVFPMTRKPLTNPELTTMVATTNSSITNTLSEDQIIGMIHKILRELKEDESLKKEGIYNKPDQMNALDNAKGPNSIPLSTTTNKPVQDQIPDYLFESTMEKIGRICEKIKEQLLIKGIVDKIQECFKQYDRIVVILKLDNDYLARTEETRYALSLLGCVAGALMLTTITWPAKEYCYPSRNYIDYSLLGLYRDIVLELTSHQMDEEKNCNPQILRDILDMCAEDEFCMKVFTHALYAKPKRSSEELSKLNSTLQILPKSSDTFANKMLKFSYTDLPKDYKSCLLYLAIFPQQQSIRRSTLIGRWVTEGLITKEDWPSSVRRANQCFQALIDRWLIYPADTSTTGHIKSCVVGDIVHGFVTKVARKQRIVETRLSHHLARHFSIFNDLRLRSSDGIDKFFQRLSESARVSLLKVLDLEGCHIFGEKYQHYMKDICNKMLLLKYLGLRGTNITHLPREINNLHELEVLDIRQTQVPESATVSLLLLKLKRLLAGHICLSPSNTITTVGHKEFSSVQIPDKIEKMVNVEVLSNVKARKRQDLKDIGKLWQLRKLGVVIIDKDSHLRNLLRTISDLHECIRSLSITLSTARNQGNRSSQELQDADVPSLTLKNPPKLLESLRISGTTQRKQNLLRLLSGDGRSNKLAKVTLSNTTLTKENLNVLVKLPGLQCFRLQYIACNESVLTFKKDEFENLKCFLVEGSDFTDIIFEKGAAFELEKIILSFTNIGCVSGVDGLMKLEELELNNNRCGRLLSSFDNAKQIAKLTLRGILLEQVDLQILAKKPNIRSLLLLERSCDISLSHITFNKDEFPKLNHLIVDSCAVTEIVFDSGSAPKLEKIVCSSLTSLSGIDKLPRLKELEFKGKIIPGELEEAIEKNKNKPKLKRIEPEIQDQAAEQEDDDNDARFPFCLKTKV